MFRADGDVFQALVTATQRTQDRSRFGLVREVTQMLADRYRRLLDNAPDLALTWPMLLHGCLDEQERREVAGQWQTRLAGEGAGVAERGS